VSFYHPTDGYLYGWRWSNGDEAWWSTEDLALRHPRDIAGQPGQPIRRRYVVGAVEPWSVEGLPALVATGPGETGAPSRRTPGPLARQRHRVLGDDCARNWRLDHREGGR
jgi:hypothetical protein